MTGLPAMAGDPPLDSDESLTLLVHTAVDCQYCKVWRASPDGQAAATQLSKTAPLFKVIIIERKSIFGSETESLYPKSLLSLYEARKVQYQLAPATPMFEIVRRGQVVQRRSGLTGWTDAIFPALKELEANRLVAASASEAPAAQP